MKTFILAAVMVEVLAQATTKPAAVAATPISTTPMQAQQQGTMDGMPAEHQQQLPTLLHPMKGGVKVPFACTYHCGAQSPSGCWCDDKCANHGDCCYGKAQICDHVTYMEWNYRVDMPNPPVAQGSQAHGTGIQMFEFGGSALSNCVGLCGKASSYYVKGVAEKCYCDNSCHFGNDCCPDKVKYCGEQFVNQEPNNQGGGPEAGQANYDYWGNSNAGDWGTAGQANYQGTQGQGGSQGYDPWSSMGSTNYQGTQGQGGSQGYDPWSSMGSTNYQGTQGQGGSQGWDAWSPMGSTFGR